MRGPKGEFKRSSGAEPSIDPESGQIRDGGCAAAEAHRTPSSRAPTSMILPIELDLALEGESVVRNLGEQQIARGRIVPELHRQILRAARRQDRLNAVEEDGARCRRLLLRDQRGRGERE